MLYFVSYGRGRAQTSYIRGVSKINIFALIFFMRTSITFNQTFSPLNHFCPCKTSFINAGRLILKFFGAFLLSALFDLDKEKEVKEELLLFSCLKSHKAVAWYAK